LNGIGSGDRDLTVALFRKYLEHLRRMIMNTNIQTQTTLRPAALLLCGAMTVCGLQTTARAADDGLPKQTVSYADLDISKPAGAKALYRRIAAAARKVCTVNSYQGLTMVTQERICTDKAIDNAVKAVGSPALSALRPTTMTHLASN
jgi:UrcA family protein